MRAGGAVAEVRIVVDVVDAGLGAGVDEAVASALVALASVAHQPVLVVSARADATARVRWSDAAAAALLGERAGGPPDVDLDAVLVARDRRASTDHLRQGRGVRRTADVLGADGAGHVLDVVAAPAPGAGRTARADELWWVLRLEVADPGTRGER